jgi:hypothetical protein
MSNKKKLIGWRVCVGRHTRRGWLVRSLFTGTQGREWHFVAAGLRLPQMSAHVGTTRKFCLDYYAGCSDLALGECEVLMKLDVTDCLDNPEHAERWEWLCGTEAIATTPMILSIETLPELQTLQSADSRQTS